MLTGRSRTERYSKKYLKSAFWLAVRKKKDFSEIAEVNYTEKYS